MKYLDSLRSQLVSQFGMISSHLYHLVLFSHPLIFSM